MKATTAVSRCIFCDNLVDSGEHLWPRWARKLLKRAGHLRRTETAIDYPAASAPFGTISHWTVNGSTYQKKVHVVCRTCNNGWMNLRHENPSRKYLKPMMKGESVSLDFDAQRYRFSKC
jgi:hypothetical protein